jgi:low temperature requirement protein LtrA
VLFGVAYLIVCLLHLLLYTLAGKRDPDLLTAVLRFTPTALLAPVIILAAAFLDGWAQGALTHVVLRARIFHFLRPRTEKTPGWIGPGRLAAGMAMPALIPAASSYRR